MNVKGRLKNKLVFSIVILIISVMIILSWVSIYRQTRQGYDSLRKRGLTLARNTAYNSAYGVTVCDEATLLRIIDGVKSEEEVIYIIFQNLQGKVLASTDTGVEKEVLQGPINKGAVQATQPLVNLSETKTVGSVYNVVVPVVGLVTEEEEESLIGEDTELTMKRPVDKKVGAATKVGVVRIGMTTENTRAQTQRMVIEMVLLTLGIIIIAIFPSFFLAETITKPIRSLNRAAINISKGDFSQRVDIKSKDEIGTLGDSFNLMTEQLQKTTTSIDNLNKEIEERKRAEEALRRARYDLEIRVKERTAELAKANDELQAEISERKQTEEKLKLYAAKLEWSNRQLQEFAYVASHDLQEPLRKVMVFGDRLKAKYSEILGDQGQDYIERMYSATKRMQTFINDLLMYSRVTTKAQPFVPVDLTTVAKEVLSDLEVRIEQIDARVEVGDLPTIETDPLQMRQLFQNLIGNALKFHKKDERLVVKVMGEFIHDGNGNTPDNEFYQITVEDNGIGFEEKYRDRIFGIFQRLHGRSEYDGSGVGLAICHKIVERHGGSIKAESTPGQGAAFIITLPVKQLNGGKNVS